MSDGIEIRWRPGTNDLPVLAEGVWPRIVDIVDRVRGGDSALDVAKDFGVKLESVRLLVEMAEALAPQGDSAGRCPCAGEAGREAAMVTVCPGVWCDPCIAPLVRALNEAEYLPSVLSRLNPDGIRTLASCCGHEKRPGKIALADGRELFILPDFKAARELDNLIARSEEGSG